MGTRYSRVVVLAFTLSKSRQTAVAVPISFGPNDYAPVLGEGPTYGQLAKRSKSAWIAGHRDLLSPYVIFECGRNGVGLPFRNGVRQESPKTETQCPIGVDRKGLSP
jgi:hypothetical protein